MFTDRAYHDTYYVVAHGHYLASLAFVSLLLVAVFAGTRRLTSSRSVRRLNGVAAALYLLGLALMLTQFALVFWISDPKVYLDVPHWLHRLNMLASIASFLMFVAVILGIALFAVALWQRLTQRPG